MASVQLQGMRVAIVATDDFEQSELTEPKKALEEAGARGANRGSSTGHDPRHEA